GLSGEPPPEPNTESLARGSESTVRKSKTADQVTRAATRSPASRGPCGSAATDAAIDPPADAPNAAMRWGFTRNRWALSRTNRTAASASCTAAGYGNWGARRYSMLKATNPCWARNRARPAMNCCVPPVNPPPWISSTPGNGPAPGGVYTSMVRFIPSTCRYGTTGSNRTVGPGPTIRLEPVRSEEHTSELQSRGQLVCRLLLE